jgi:uncharacterized protein (DUF305 family)
MGGWRWLVLGVALAIGAGAGLGAGAMVWGGDHEDDPAVAAGSAESGHGMAAGAAQGGDAEKGFLAGMIAHHRMAVDMAEQAAGRSEHPEVRRLAGEIVRVQTREIERMRGWYRDWYGQDPPEEPRAGDLALGMGADPAALAASRPFDRAFLAAMIPHHAGAILEADRLLAGSARPEVRRLAAEIIAAQSTEIGRMQAWRARWYPPLG